MEHSGLNSSSSCPPVPKISRRNRDVECYGEGCYRIYHCCCLMDVFSLLQQLSEALKKFHFGKWKLNEGDGAFYGPKIDIKIWDAL
ncbi:hypothetical protein JB92DRAFT_696887 [Gautieria morchelliformis]|nr:hypothetical protein JB92DRAFT_696887 [Gautieria morchelliformis]